jgi:uncharacterized protein YbcV (DUF1398 family)
MSPAIEKLTKAMEHATNIRPKVGGFPYLAEVLRATGVRKNIWTLPACESLYLTEFGVVVHQGRPLVSGMNDVASFDEAALIKALRTDQAGQSTFPEFLFGAWKAGVVRYEVDFTARTVVYFGSDEESYTESYPSVDLPK